MLLTSRTANSLSSENIKPVSIADVVTGKLDVRSVAAQLRAEIKEPEPFDETGGLIDGEEEPIETASSSEEAAV